jgi:hypothetical protein
MTGSHADDYLRDIAEQGRADEMAALKASPPGDATLRDCARRMRMGPEAATALLDRIAGDVATWPELTTGQQGELAVIADAAREQREQRENREGAA